MLSNVGATAFDPLNLRQLVGQADLIFEGVVTAVEYRMSARTTAVVALPHTFVTFEIAQTLKGSTAGSGAITLRFQGGPDGQGNAMMVSGVPLFDVGQRDILFVSGNDAHICPLVGWEQGRFRVIGGLVYTNGGQEVWVTRRGEIAFGPYHALDEVLTHNLDGTRLTFESPAAEAARTPPTGLRWMDASGFKNIVAGLVGQLHTPTELEALQPATGVDARKPFSVPASRPAAPPKVPTTAEGASTEDKQPGAEEQQQDDEVPRLDKPGR
jgi:hypothetical protein